MTLGNEIFKNRDGEENAVVGRKFQNAAQQYFKQHEGLELTSEFPLNVGLREQKTHRFDLGSRKELVLVECKRHTWIRDGKIPTGKMQAWNEAMFLLYLAPTEYRKILFVLSDYNEKRVATLAEYYVKTYSHLIPAGVEIIESDRQGEQVRVIKEAF